MHSSSKGYIYAFLSTVLLAAGYINNFYIMQGASPESTAFAIFGIGSLITLAILVVYRKKNDMRSIRKHWKHLLAVGILNGISAILWFQTLSSIGPALSGFLFRFVTVFTVLMGVVFLGEKFNKGEAFGMVLVVAGAFVITYTDLSVAAGAALAVASSFCFALMGFVSKKYLHAVRPLALNTVRVLAAFSVISAYAISRGSMAVPGMNLMVFVLFSAVFIVNIGFLLYFRAIRHAELSKVGVIGALEPFFILLLSFLLLQRMPTSAQLAGGFVIMLGIGAILYFRRKPAVVAAEIE